MAQESATSQTPGLEEIIVTATRREEDVSKVPISITAYTSKKMDMANVRMIDDVMRMTPGVQFSRSSNRGGQARISIRGVSSNAGAGTTGVYINDTPIQSRQAGNQIGDSAWPQVFDIKRIEILRGPQGTLFGSGSEGGTVRIITPKPNTERFGAYVRLDGAATEGGAPTAGVGGAANVPLIDNKLGIRFSASVRHDGGYVDRINGSTGRVLAKNENSVNSRTFRVALAYTPTSTVTVTPSFYWQKQSFNGSSTFDLAKSNPEQHNLRHTGFMTEGSHNDFQLSSLKIQWELPAFTLISNTSRFDRHGLAVGNLIRFEAAIWGNTQHVPDGFYAPDTDTLHQNVFTQEIRLQSNNPDSRLTWVAGVFYQHNEQSFLETAQDTFLPILWQLGGNPGTFEQAFGMGLKDGLYTVQVGPWLTVDKQLAVFGQVDYDLTDKLKLTLGTRVSKVDLSSDITYAGPIVGGTFRERSSSTESPVTPKLGLSYQATPGTMAYVTVAKGYRIGGGNNPVPISCGRTTGPNPIPGTALGDLGLTDRPDSYESDSLWSYEIGSKTRTLNGRLAVDASIYYIKWKNIQTHAPLPQCGFNFVTNAGSATSKGFELSVQAKPIDALSLGVAIGRVKASYDHTIYLDPEGTNDLHTAGARIWAHPWTVSFNGQVSFPLLQQDAYFRLNYIWQSKLDHGLPSFDPESSAYDPTLPGVPEIKTLRLRLGVLTHGVNVALYVNNATNEHPLLNYGHIPGTSLFRAGTLRPRTVGVTMSYRY